MGTVRRFEDLIAWQKARELTRLVYRVTATGPMVGEPQLRRQLRSAAISIQANVAEGFERSHRKELLQFLAIAKGSCAELRSHLYVALDAGYIAPAEFEVLKASAEEVSRILAGLRYSLQRRSERSIKA
jgi:four helix bundle protein